MKKTCLDCNGPFDISHFDMEFYRRAAPMLGDRRFEIPPPRRCPTCRLIQKMAFDNNVQVFRRQDSWDGSQLLSMYPSQSPIPVIDPGKWAADSWDPMEFGLEVSSKIGFLRQWGILSSQVPRPARRIWSSENCDYCTKAYNSYNCYLVAGFAARDCMYGVASRDAEDCMDFYCALHSRHCYDTVLCQDCYEVHYSQLSRQCSQSWFLFDCQSCANCFGCVALYQKQYCVFNEQLSQAAYETFLKEANLGSYSSIRRWQGRYAEFKRQHPRLYAHLSRCEAATGDHLTGLKNCRWCFECDSDQGRIEDCAFCSWTGGSAQDCYDMFGTGEGTSLSYHSGPQAFRGRNIYFSMVVESADNVFYCDHCTSISNCFGCIGLKHKEYCILNKQYTKSQYLNLVPELIAGMQAEETWAEFFPGNLSPWAYNQSDAQFFFPLQREMAIQRGFRWAKEEEQLIEGNTPALPAAELPDHIEQVTDELLKQVIKCELSGRLYRIEARELAFYRRALIPLPRLHPLERMRQRAALRGSWQLWDRQCSDCGCSLETPVAEADADKVLCGSCFLSASGRSS